MHRPAGAKGGGGTVTQATDAVFPIHRALLVAWGPSSPPPQAPSTGLLCTHVQQQFPRDHFHSDGLEPHQELPASNINGAQESQNTFQFTPVVQLPTTSPGRPQPNPITSLFSQKHPTHAKAKCQCLPPSSKPYSIPRHGVWWGSPSLYFRKPLLTG